MTIFPITVFDEIGSQIIENEEIFKAFLQNYEYMCAAGGLVVNDNDEILMIFRRNRWDFPKGKVEKGEPISVTAQREVKEETGVNATIIDDIPLSTFHLYQFGTNIILKETFWFRMIIAENSELIPQREEDITQVAWVPRSQVCSYLQNSYSSLRELWSRF